jgi:sensor domain CHASE-containing protein
MSLKTRISVILLAVVACYAVLDYAIQAWGVYPSFATLEREEAVKDMDRCVEALNREIHHLDKLCGDWAPWDDTYKFAQECNKEYIESNLTPTTFKNDRLNLLYVYDNDGYVVWGQAAYLKGDELEIIKAGGLMPDPIPKGHFLVNHPTILGTVTGIMMTAKGPMLVSSRPILTSQQKGPPAGTLVMGRFLDDSLVKVLAEQTRVDFQLWPAGSRDMPESAKDVPAIISEDNPVVVREHGRDLVRVYRTYADIQGKPALLLQAEVPRDITAKGRNALRFAMVSILAVGGVTLAVLIFLVQRTVIRPISILTRYAVAIGKSDDLSSRIKVRRNDEIGQLSREFNHMVEKLGEARRVLMDQSFRFGVAEMAGGVLHNLRNAINPISVKAAAMRECLRHLPLDQLEAAKTELRRPDLAAQRKGDLEQFLNLAGENLLGVVRRLREQLDMLAEQTVQVEHILNEQDQFSRAERPAETCELKSMVSAAIAMIPVELCNSVSIYVDPSVAELKPLRTHGSTVVQVLANVLVNAAESIQRAGLPHGEIHLWASLEQVKGLEMCHLRVQDNGDGIAPENLHRLFERGFSTKKDTSGVGLHWSFNSLAAMTGLLRAESPGPQHGATFHVLVPTTPTGHPSAIRSATYA